MKDYFEPLGDGLGFVRLVDWIGDELAIVNAARVSFAKESEWEHPSLDDSEVKTLEDVKPKLSKADAGLVRFLLKNQHGTPFEQGFMAQFHCRVPIFVMREWIRHRVGWSYNEESGRYTELRRDFYYPQSWRTQVGKPGNYTFEEIGETGTTNWAEGVLKMHSERAFDLYRSFLDQGIAKEQARMVLPLNLYTEFRCTCNARSLMNFLRLRNHKDAMKEIRLYAEALEEIFSQKMPAVHAAFIDADRTAP